MRNPVIYKRDYYQRLCKLEDQYWWHVGMSQIAAALLRSRGQERHYAHVLDAGCGTGGTMQWAVNILGSKLVAGVDISLEALKLCRMRTGLILSQGSVLLLPFQSRSFDLVICQDVLQHLPTDDSDIRALKEIFRVIRPGGLLLVRANSRLGMWQEDAARDADYQRYTLPEVISRVRASGFTVIAATYANVLPAFYASLKRWIQLRFGRHQHHRLYEGLPVQSRALRWRWLNRLLVSLLAAEASYLSTPGRTLAFGHSTICLGVKPPVESMEPSGI